MSGILVKTYSSEEAALTFGVGVPGTSIQEGGTVGDLGLAGLSFPKEVWQFTEEDGGLVHEGSELGPLGLTFVLGWEPVAGMPILQHWSFSFGEQVANFPERYVGIMSNLGEIVVTEFGEEIILA